MGAETVYELCREIMRASHSDLQVSANDRMNKLQESFSATRLALIRYLEAPRQMHAGLKTI